MNCITITIQFDDGQEMHFIGPVQNLPNCEISNVYFSDPAPFPDCKLSDISEMSYEHMSETKH